ncbi:nuclear transport factor 2 family protein [Streptomyces inhibens]|uniref:nuclear transport factor 2 family protein n=1 Tax=Streptomyces inhibens TaxID=2293571 RepID=UPI001EE75111|nr:nuclear transport factor 2 family protein [Streptomyces inhibens]UKY51769.1 nuclear transport factor 2 family protein [Streptomyces inhibens]
MTAHIEELVPAAGGEEFGRVYAEVQQFYAEHFHLLDSGQAEAWAATFAEDATFEVPTQPKPTQGRAQLTTVMRRTAQELAEAGEVRRHWHGMVAVHPQDDGSLHVRCYALVFASKKGGSSQLHRVCVCADVLVRENGKLLVQTRKVSRDDLP